MHIRTNTITRTNMVTRITTTDSGDAGVSPGNATWLAGLLQTTDSLFPTGAYAHSFGLEGLSHTEIVTDLKTLRAFLLEDGLPALARTDLPIAAHAWEAAGEPVDWNSLRKLCLLGSALRGAREPREACEAIGSQRLDLAEKLHGGIAREFNQHAVRENWPRPSSVAAAIEARALGAPREAMLSAIIYSTTAGFISASVKLLRLGQNACQTLLTEALETTPQLIDTALALEAEEIGSYNPWWDIAASRHEHADFRLFIS